MRYLVSGQIRKPCPLSAAEYFTLAIREWEMVLGWLASGTALAYGRLGGPEGGALLLDVASEAEARALARTLPFAPYAELSVRPSSPDGFGQDVARLFRADLWAAVPQ